MPIEVEGPDGALYEFPDGTPQATIAGAMRKRYPAPKAVPVAKPKGQGSYASPFDLSGGQSRTAIPKGSYYRDPDGNIRVNENFDAGNPIITAPRKAGKRGKSVPFLNEAAGLAANLNRGLFNVGDEFTGALGTAVDTLTGKVRPRAMPGDNAIMPVLRGVGDAFDRNMATTRRVEDDARERRPLAAGAAQALGTTASIFVPGGALPAAATRAGAAGQAALVGATQGAVMGALDRGTMAERGQAALTGGLVGGALGGALGGAIGGPPRVKSTPKVDPNVRLLAEEGVMMTPGQIRGGIAKSLEDKMTSMPILGDEIQRARISAMGDFTRAPINRALREIGDDLPPGMTGNEAIAFAQQRFSEGYQAAVPSAPIRLADEFTASLEDAVMPSVQTLTPQSRARLQNILAQRLNSRMDGDVLSPEAYKRVQSELDFEIRRFSPSQDADERAIGEALGGVKKAIADAAEMQDPQFAAKITALNRGYANLVRAEGAAARTGAEGGVFSPAQFDQAVRAGDQTTRRRGYAAGNALGQDLADAGRAVLPSKIPDSGTAGRGFIGLALGGGSALAGGPLGMLATAGGLKAASLLYTPRAVELANRALRERLSQREAQAVVEELREIAQRNPQALELLREVETTIYRGAGAAGSQTANPPRKVPAQR
jgi:hypothetical protein